MRPSLARWIFAATLLLALSAASELRAQNGLDFSVRNLDFTVRDLIFSNQDLPGQAAPVAAPNTSLLRAPSTPLLVTETATEIRIELAADILFDFDKYDIRPSAQNALTQAAALIRERNRGTVRVEGHTDSKGGDAYNDRLSLRRAAAVRAWLMDRERLGNLAFVVTGYGAKRPVAPNATPRGADDPEGRQKNRRVEIVIEKK
jgi:outer membrane protein OmpA-like peptidoglycan-associated protein